MPPVHDGEENSFDEVTNENSVISCDHLNSQLIASTPQRGIGITEA